MTVIKPADRRSLQSSMAWSIETRKTIFSQISQKATPEAIQNKCSVAVICNQETTEVTFLVSKKRKNIGMCSKDCVCTLRLRIVLLDRSKKARYANKYFSFLIPIRSQSVGGIVLRLIWRKGRWRTCIRSGRRTRAVPRR